MEDGFRLPIENKCSNSFLKIQSACRYVTNSLVIMGTNWKNSFYNYDSFELDDTIFISNSLGNKFRYHIIDIVKSNDLNQLLERNQDLMIIVRNYYAGEYMGYICVQC